MKIAHIDENSKLLGWYDKDIHTSIPTPNIEVTDEQWQVAINSGHNKVNEDGSTEYFDFRTSEEIESQKLLSKIQEAKQYLSLTDFKMTVDYFNTLTKEIQDELTRLRNEAREFIRSNQ